MQRPEVQAKVTDLKQHTGPNEKGYKFMKDGTPPQEAPPALNSNYAVNIGFPSLLEGYHHITQNPDGSINAVPCP